MGDTVQIQMKGTQIYVDGDGTVEENKSKATGEAYYKNDMWYVTFTEQDEEGKETKSLLKVAEDKVELTRKGQVSTKLVFEKGKKYSTTYDTPFGSMLLSVETSVFRILKSEKNIHVVLEYETALEDKKIADNTMSIVIRF